MNKTAVVFGATGLVGQALVTELLAGDEYGRIVAVLRKNLPVTDPKLEQINIPAYSQLMEYQDKLNATTFFCCIGTTIKIAGSKEVFRQVDLGIPKQIAQLAEQLAIPNLVIVSSIGADSVSPNFYLHTKGEMETETRKVYNGNLKIVRPSLLMGKRTEFRAGEKIAIVFMQMIGWMFVGPLRKYKGIRVSHLAKAMIAVAQLPAGKVVFESDDLQDMA